MLGTKIRVFQYKPKKSSKKARGHRSRLSRITIEDIAVGSPPKKGAAAKAAPEQAPGAEAAPKKAPAKPRKKPTPAAEKPAAEQEA
jgi:hypothetical protein